MLLFDLIIQAMFIMKIFNKFFTKDWKRFVVGVLFLLTSCGKKENEKLAQTYYKFAVVELTEGEQQEKTYRKALNYIQKAIEQKNVPEYLALRATLLFKLNKEKEGYECFQKVLNEKLSSDKRAEVLNNKACLLAQLGFKNNQKEKINEAVGIWKDLENNKSYLTPEVALFNQGNVYFLQKKYKKAKNKFKNAIFLAPNYLDAHYCLALACYKLQDFNLMKDEIKTVLFLEPEHKGAKQLSLTLQK